MQTVIIALISRFINSIFMAEIIPFKAVRPTRDKVHLVATRSYVTYQPRHLNRKLHENPFSFVHIINPEFGKSRKSRPNSDARFNKIKKRFEEFCEEEILMQDEKEAFYIYRQITPTHSFTGIICGVGVNEYTEGHIKIHEQTLTSRVGVFTKYLDICDFNAEPVLLTYRSAESIIDVLITKSMNARPEYDFTTTDRNQHQLWLIDNEKDIMAVQKEFAKLDCLYIADGHHRMASSALLGEKRMKRKDWKPTDISNFALALILPEKELNIRPFHRVIRLDEPIDEKKFLTDLEAHYKVVKKKGTYFPKANHEFGMRLSKGWFSLTLKDKMKSEKVVEHLDPMILTNTILEPLFDIHDQKTDRRIQFIPGKESLDKFEKSIDQGLTTVLFTLHSTSTEQLFAVSDANEIMPPKSTYVEPKLRSGLTIMKLS